MFQYLSGGAMKVSSFLTGVPVRFGDDRCRVLPAIVTKPGKAGEA